VRGMPPTDTIRKRVAHVQNRQRAREMRHKPVAMEKLFWSRLRDRQLGGFKFRRQYLIGPYIVDFVCTERKLIIELDGPLHADQVEYDRRRDVYLRRQGYRVMRLKNSELSEADLAKIQRALASPSPQPSPPVGERERS
jgi:very-short-patch-repair endonuclease